ncbi:MAG: ATP-binding protein [Candidatus Poribacteria bacterium]|nr:ATP-binding protein [Candidatus Poribacteria bacterium]
MPLPTLELFLGALAFVANTSLGVVVLRRRSSSWTNRLFFALTFFIDVYIVVNYYSLHPPLTTPGSGDYATKQLLWIRLVMFVCSFIGPTLVLFAHTFPRDRVTMRRRWWGLLGALGAASAAASIGPFVFKGIHYPNGQPMPIPGMGMPIFFLDFIGLFIASFVILTVRYRRATDSDDRAKYRLLWIGILASFTIMGTATVVSVVVFKTSAFVFMGPIAPVILMGFTAYAIVRHRLFQMEIAATQALVGTLLIVLFSKIWTAASSSAVIVDTLIFSASIFVGLLLVRSVRREIHLREEAESLNRQLQSANSQLEQSNSELRQYAHVVSHDLKEPLRVVESYAELFTRRYKAELEGDGAEFLTFLVEGVRRMRTMLDALMSYTRVGGAVAKVATADSNELVDEVVRVLAIRLDETGGVVTCDPLPTLAVDGIQFGQLLQNLIENALKFRGDAPPTVHISAERGTDEWVFSVRDNGIGVDPHYHEGIFDLFRRLHTRDEYPGTGLGLATCKKIVQRHGGRIWVESTLGEGSAFRFTIPDHRPPRWQRRA